MYDLGRIVMPKSSREQIDIDEKKIVAILKTNSKDSIDVIAKKCGFSRQKVWRIIKRLEKNKTIWGYSAIADDEKLDSRHFTILVKRTTMPFKDKMYSDMMNSRLDEYFPETKIVIEDILFVHGEYDFIISLTSPGIIETKMFCEKVMNKLLHYVLSYKILETITPLRKNGIRNPNMNKVKSLV
jgi:DNA-binding Lrp family transcriptional regulator